jgi:hypothetical protein
VAIDQFRLGELKRLRSYFLGWGMSAKAAGVDEEIAKLYRAAKQPAPVDETVVVVESAVVEAPVVETADNAAVVNRRPARKR